MNATKGYHARTLLTQKGEISLINHGKSKSQTSDNELLLICTKDSREMTVGLFEVCMDRIINLIHQKSDLF